EQLDDLIQSYPNNVLSGERSGMRSMFPAVLRKLKVAQAQKNRSIQEQVQAAGNQQQEESDKRTSPIVGTNGILDKQW
ncbi:hypothetical protein AB4142_38810, partial [Variovorax sp. 2RAF20]